MPCIWQELSDAQYRGLSVLVLYAVYILFSFQSQCGNVKAIYWLNTMLYKHIGCSTTSGQPSNPEDHERSAQPGMYDHRATTTEQH